MSAVIVPDAHPKQQALRLIETHQAALGELAYGWDCEKILVEMLELWGDQPQRLQKPSMWPAKYWQQLRPQEAPESILRTKVGCAEKHDTTGNVCNVAMASLDEGICVLAQR